jgi:hypothetical protein
VTAFAATQTASCHATSIEMSTAEASLVSPTNFVPVKFTDLTSPPFIFNCQDSKLPKLHLFYLRINFDGGFKIMSVASSSQMTLDVQLICTGTPVLTLNDTTPITLVYALGTGSKTYDLV